MAVPKASMLWPSTSTSTIMTPEMPAVAIRITLLPQKPFGPPGRTRVRLMVTLLAATEIQPVTSRASMTVPGVVTLISPLGVRAVPAGTPVLPGPGQPPGPAATGGAGRGVTGLGLSVARGNAVGVGDGDGTGVGR